MIVRDYVEVAEKARYLYEWARNAIGVPAYSTAEAQNITNYYVYLNSFFSCRKTGLCR